jgi:hypothetical protein
MTTIQQLEAELEEAQNLVKLYAQLGDTYMAIGKRDQAYAKRNEAIAQQSRVLTIKAVLKSKGQTND